MKSVAVAAILFEAILASPASADWLSFIPQPWSASPKVPADLIPTKPEIELPRPVPLEGFSDLLRRVEPETNGWQGTTYDPGRLKLSRESILEGAKVQSNFERGDLRELREAPWRTTDWKSQQSLSVPLPAVESIFVFGKLDSAAETFDNQRFSMSGRTGLGLKWSPMAKSELQFRSGTVTNISDLYNQSRPQEKSQLSVELQAKLALLDRLQLQYSGEALPALFVTDRHTVLQDLKLAVPLGTNREFHIGAKYRWEDLATTPWLDRTQIYLGLKFQH